MEASFLMLFTPTDCAASRSIPARAWIFRAPNQPMDAVATSLPAEPAPGEVVVQLRLATICGSDLHTFDGRRQEPTPTVLGHEGVGVIVALGPGRSGLTVGDRVTWSLIDHCGHCAPCTSWDVPQKCVELFKYGHAHWEEGSAPNGCYATHLLIRPGTHVVKLPDQVSDRMAVSANCALSTMVHAVERLLGGEKTVWIQGGGLLGLFGAALLKDRGVPRVIVTEPNPDRRAIVTRLGVEAMSTEEFAAQPKLSAGGCDAVIEVAGDSSVVGPGVNALRPGGAYLWVGMVHPATPLSSLTGEQVVRRCMRVGGVYNYAPRHLDGAIDFLARRGADFPFDEVISPSLPLSQLNDAFTLAFERRWARVSVDCTQP